MVAKVVNPKKHITVWIVWKYIDLDDTYKSILESIIHAWAFYETKVNINWIDSELLENEFYKERLDEYRKSEKLDAILVPWGFGERGVEWMIHAANFARVENVPYLWICLWMQVAVLEYARNISWLTNANSTEFSNNCEHKVIDIMDNQKDIKDIWGTLRVWSYEAILKKWSLAEKLYESTKISERHRHRFEVNHEYHDIFTKYMTDYIGNVSW